jgi:hypothetical protein
MPHLDSSRSLDRSKRPSGGDLMAGTRTVYRGSKGRFAGASAGKAEKVRVGGFANAAFQARFQSTRASRAAARPSSPAGAKAPRATTASRRRSPSGIYRLGRLARKAAPKAVSIGVTAGVGFAAANVVRGGGIGRGNIGIRINTALTTRTVERTFHNGGVTRVRVPRSQKVTAGFSAGRLVKR